MHLRITMNKNWCKAKKLRVSKDMCSVYAFACLYFYALLKTTMAYGGVIKYITLGILAIGFGLIFVDVFVFDSRFKKGLFIWILAWLALAVLINIKDYHGTTFDEYIIDLVFYIVLGLTLTKTDFRDIADTAYGISIIVIPMVMVLAKLGLIENLVFWRFDGMMGNRRESFGFGYPTDFASHLFFVMLLHFYRRNGKLRGYDYLAFIAVALFVNKFCDARLTVVSIILLILVSFMYPIITKNNRTVWNILLCWGAPLCAAFSWLLILLYKFGSGLAVSIDRLMSYRLSITNNMLAKYGIKLFGQYFSQHGYGGGISETQVTYSYVDMSFVRIVMMFGIVFFVILMILTVIKMRYFIRTKDYLLPLIMLVVSICSIADQHFFDFSYNVFLLTIFIGPISAGDIYNNSKPVYGKQGKLKKGK